MEANLLINERAKELHRIDVFSKDPAIRRKTIKSLVYRLPGRPVLIFLCVKLVVVGTP